jgi:hypothetical protein
MKKFILLNATPVPNFSTALLLRVKKQQNILTRHSCQKIFSFGINKKPEFISVFRSLCFVFCFSCSQLQKKGTLTSPTLGTSEYEIT